MALARGLAVLALAPTGTAVAGGGSRGEPAIVATSRPPVNGRGEALRESIDELRPELEALDPHRRPRSEMRVTDARLAALEGQLARALGLPSALRARLTTSAEHRRSVADDRGVFLTVVHRATERELGNVTLSWDGSCAIFEGVRFLRDDRRSCAHHPGLTHELGSWLADCFDGLTELALVARAHRDERGVSVAAERLTIESLRLRRVNPARGADPPTAVARIWSRSQRGIGEASVALDVRLPLAAGAEGGGDRGGAHGSDRPDTSGESRGSDRGPGAGASTEATPAPPFAGMPRTVTTGDVLTTLAEVEECLTALPLRFPHALRVEPVAASVPGFALRLDSYRRGDPELPLVVRVTRAADGREWRAYDREGVLGPEGLSLATFAALVEWAEVLVETGEGPGPSARLAAVGVALEPDGDDAGSVYALVVSGDDPWRTEGARLHSARWSVAGQVQPTGAQSLASGSVAPGPTRRIEFELASGERLVVTAPDDEILTTRRMPPSMEVGGRALALLGGSLVF